MVIRRYTFKLYPSRAQAEALDKQRRMHCALYNALLQQRIEAYRRVTVVDQKTWTGKGKSLGYYDQCKELTALRADDPEYAALASASMEATAQRLDRAYQAFFKRAKKGAGAASGFPRFKRSDDYPGFSFKKHGSGWKLTLDADKPKGRLYVKGVEGTIRLRGCLPTEATFKTCDLLWRHGEWWLSLVVEMEPRRVAGSVSCEIHLNLVTNFASIRKQNGGCPAGPEAAISVADDGRIAVLFQGDGRTSGVETPVSGGDDRPDQRVDVALEGVEAPVLGGDDRVVALVGRRNMGVEPPGSNGDDRYRGFEANRLLDDVAPIADGNDKMLGRTRNDADHIGNLQAAMARCKRGSYRYRQLRRQCAKLQYRQAERRKNRLHNLTAGIAKEFGAVSIVAPKSIKDITASAAGTERNPGAAVRWKAGLNRYILDMAPAMFIEMVTNKVTEGGGTVTVVEDQTPAASIGNNIVRVAKAAKTIKRKAKYA